MSGSCLLLCLLFSFCAYVSLRYGFSVDPIMAFWGLIGASWYELVLLVDNEKALKDLLAAPFVIAGVCFGQRRAMQRSDQSSLRGLLVCWLCACWNNSLRRKMRPTAQLGSECLRAGQAISACFIFFERMRSPSWTQAWLYQYCWVDWEHFLPKQPYDFCFS